MQVTVKDLTKTFASKQERVRALNAVTLTSPPNQVLTLLGPSGCGKTTLLRCIAGLEVPDDGEILIGDELVSSKSRGVFVPPERRGLGMVFQSYAIWPHMTVFDNVAFPLRVRHSPRQEIQQRVREVLDLVQLSGLERRPATRLSGGQQQRVALARALVAKPRVILFDEPLSNLDAKLRESTRKELRGFLSALGISSIYVTHDQVEALTISDEIAVMYDGIIVERGTPEEIYFRATNPFVIDFIGKANFFEAMVNGYTGRYVVASTPLGQLLCNGPSGLAPGSKVKAYIRPEAFKLLPSDVAPAQNQFEGTITMLLFAGDCYEAEIRVNSLNLHAKIDVDANIKVGSRVKLHVPPERCRIILREETR